MIGAIVSAMVLRWKQPLSDDFGHHHVDITQCIK